MPYVNLVPIINYIMYAWQEKFYILCQGGRFLYGPAFGCRAGIVPLSARSRSAKNATGAKLVKHLAKAQDYFQYSAFFKGLRRNYTLPGLGLNCHIFTINTISL